MGSESPAKGSAKEQSIAGTEGGPREGGRRGVGDQPPQSSGRRGARHEHRPEASKHLESEQDPSQQGRGPERAQTIKERPDMRGIGSRSGSSSGRADRSEEEAQRGEPASTHTRHGRQRVKGDRGPAQPD